MIQVVELTLPFPPSANTAYPTNANGRRHLSKRGAAFKTEAGWIATSTLRPVQGATCVTMHISLYPPTKRKLDVDNYVKLTKDLICETLRIDDDYTHVPSVSVRFCEVDSINPRCTVVLEVLA